MTLRLQVLAVLVLLSSLFLACDGREPPPPPSDGVETIIAHAVDGDTVELADGRRVRYIGINTPERDQPFYQEATETNRRLVEGKKAWIALDTQSTDQYGRILAYVWVDDQFINLELVRLGYANAYTQPPNVRYSTEFIAAEQEAREAQVGLWTPADVQLRIQEIAYDAPGADDQNPNGEWVALINEGSQVIDLAGFTLKDEANHIYTFPAVGLEPGRTLRIYSGEGRDSGDALYWGLRDDAVWNNSGDTAYLRDPRGKLVDSFRYSEDSQ